MPTVAARILSRRASLSPGLDKVAAFCLGDPDAASRLAVDRLAEAAGVSVATASRLAAALGYRDWKDLRLALARATPDKERGPGESAVFPDIQPDDSDETVARKVFEDNIMSLRSTFERIDPRGLMRAVRAVKKTSRVVFFGSGGSGCIARDESLRFAHLELAAEAYTEEFAMILQASRMRRGQVAFGFSNSGRSRAAVGALREARRAGAFTVGVANYPDTPLEDASDLFFLTAFPWRGGVTASLTARIAVQGIMDAIYVLACHHGRMAKDVNRIDAALERNLRLSPRARDKNGEAGHV